MPSPGAVSPARVSRSLVKVSGELSVIMPPTRKTTVRAPDCVLAQSRKEPPPESLRLVTTQTSPPRPPLAKRPSPSAPGNARQKSDVQSSGLNPQ